MLGGDPARLTLLESEIQGVDAQIRINRAPAKILAGVIYFYYREGLDSTQVGAELGFKSPCVRQLLFRIMKIALALGLETPESITCQRRDLADERSKRAADKQAALDAGRAARIAAREAAKMTTKPPRAKLGPARPRWRAAGLCIGCGGDRSAEFVYCETCRAQQRV